MCLVNERVCLFVAIFHLYDDMQSARSPIYLVASYNKHSFEVTNSYRNLQGFVNEQKPIPMLSLKIFYIFQ